MRFEHGAVRSYRSRVDAWLAALVFVPGLAMAGLPVYAYLTGGWMQAASTAAIALFYWVIILAVAFPVYYELSDRGLTIRAGVAIKYTILLNAIDGVRPTRNPLSAPAWSLRRLRIDYHCGGRGRYALISPRDRRAFLRDLGSRCHRLELDGDILRPRQP